MKKSQKILLLLIFSSFFFFTGGPEIKAFTTNYEDDFETYTPGFINGQGSWTANGTARFSVSANGAADGTSLGLWYNDDTWDGGTTATLTTVDTLSTGIYSVRMRMKMDTWTVASNNYYTGVGPYGTANTVAWVYFTPTAGNQWCAGHVAVTDPCSEWNYYIDEDEWFTLDLTIDLDANTMKTEITPDVSDPMAAQTEAFDQNENVTGIRVFNSDAFSYRTEFTVDEIQLMPSIEWDESDRYDYVDQIKDIRMLWHDYSPGNGSIFGLGIDIQNEMSTWDELIIQVDTLSINDTFDLSDITGNLLLNPEIIFRSDDYQNYWPDGQYTFEFYLSTNGTPALDTQMTLTLGQPEILSTETQYTTDFLEYDWGELNEDGSYGENPYDSALGGQWYKIKQKFPLSWIITIKDLWETTATEYLTKTDTEEDNISITWVLPSGLSASTFDSMSVALIDLEGAKNTYSAFFSAVRLIFQYSVWLTLLFTIFKKTQRLFDSLEGSVDTSAKIDGFTP